MTRAMAILFTDGRSVVSREFNAMELARGFDGQILLEHLKAVSDESGFIEALDAFNGNWYGAEDTLLYYRVKKFHRIVFRSRAYRRDWFTDFLFFCNTSQRFVRFVDVDGRALLHCPGEVIVFYFGRFHLLAYNQYQPKHLLWSTAAYRT